MLARVDEILNGCPRSAWRREWSASDAGILPRPRHGRHRVAPVTEDTVFQIASITKTSTAIAVMQLQEHGLIGLGLLLVAPATWYQSTAALPPRSPSWMSRR